MEKVISELEARVQILEEELKKYKAQLEYLSGFVKGLSSKDRLATEIKVAAGTLPPKLINLSDFQMALEEMQQNAVNIDGYANLLLLACKKSKD